MIVTAVRPIIRAVVAGHTGRRSQIARIQILRPTQNEEEEENDGYNAVAENPERLASLSTTGRSALGGAERRRRERGRGGGQVRLFASDP